MKSRMLVLWSLLCVALLLFTACGTAFVVPDVGNRPHASHTESGAGGLGYEPPPSQSAVTAESEEMEKQPPAYWRGQSHTLPGTVASTQSTASAEPSASSGNDSGKEEPQSSSIATGAEPVQSSGEATTTEPIHTTATTPDPQGEGRGDAFEVTEKSGNGTKEVQCTPFY